MFYDIWGTNFVEQSISAALQNINSFHIKKINTVLAISCAALYQSCEVIFISNMIKSALLQTIMQKSRFLQNDAFKKKHCICDDWCYMFPTFSGFLRKTQLNTRALQTYRLLFTCSCEYELWMCLWMSSEDVNRWIFFFFFLQVVSLV